MQPKAGSNAAFVEAVQRHVAFCEDAEKGFGANWMANVDQYVDHYHHYIEVADYENSDWPADLGQKPYYGVTSWAVKDNAGPGPTTDLH